MTIDDCIDWLCRLRSNVLIFMPYVWHKKMTDALTMAIDTMREYQKIKEILKDTPYGGDCDDAVRRIQEVIEDDNSTVDNSSM